MECAIKVMTYRAAEAAEGKVKAAKAAKAAKAMKDTVRFGRLSKSILLRS